MRVRTKIIVGSLGTLAGIILMFTMVFFMTIAAPPSRSRHLVKLWAAVIIPLVGWFWKRRQGLT